MRGSGKSSKDELYLPSVLVPVLVLQGARDPTIVLRTAPPALSVISSYRLDHRRVFRGPGFKYWRRTCCDIHLFPKGRSAWTTCKSCLCLLIGSEQLLHAIGPPCILWSHAGQVVNELLDGPSGIFPRYVASNYDIVISGCIALTLMVQRLRTRHVL